MISFVPKGTLCEAAIVVPALKRWAIVGGDRDRRSRLQL